MLETLDLTVSLGRDAYITELSRLQLQFRELTHQLVVQQRPAVIVVEGWPAAGKGSIIKRITEKLDPRTYVVHSVGPASGEDAAHHYLYRFWKQLPSCGQLAVFDRSWYERVLVDRVDGLVTEEIWRRAYREINTFERQLVDFGTLLVKVWVHISRAEQIRRLEGRSPEMTPHLNEWLYGDRWESYEAAIENILLKTSTLNTPWVIVEGNDRYFARVKVLRAAVEAFSRALDYQPADPLAAEAKSGKKTRRKKKKGKKHK